MNSDEQSTESSNTFTFEFTLSGVGESDSDSDSDSDTSVEYVGTNMDRQRVQNCATGRDEKIDNSHVEDPSFYTLTQQECATSLLNLYFRSNEESLSRHADQLKQQVLDLEKTNQTHVFAMQMVDVEKRFNERSIAELKDQLSQEKMKWSCSIM